MRRCKPTTGALPLHSGTDLSRFFASGEDAQRQQAREVECSQDVVKPVQDHAVHASSGDIEDLLHCADR